jgi:Ca2+/Na+ antiporter
MNEYLANILGIVLTGITFFVALFNVLFIKETYIKIYNVFLVLYCFILNVSLIIDRQIYLGELLLMLFFFIFAIIFFVFNANKKYEIPIVDEDNNFFLKSFISFILVIIFFIISLNFYGFYKNKLDFYELKNKQEEVITQVIKNKTKTDDKEKNIEKLNKNSIFQKLTNIIIYYICCIVLVYYYNKDGKIKEKNEE